MNTGELEVELDASDVLDVSDRVEEKVDDIDEEDAAAAVVDEDAEVDTMLGCTLSPLMMSAAYKGKSVKTLDF